MSTVWFTADLHLGHTRIIELSHRPFTTIVDHDQSLIDNWNDRVAKDDMVWVLGDLSIESSYTYALERVAQLNGRKRLVTGNHDRSWTGRSDALRYLAAYQSVFEVVTPWARAKVGPHKVMLSHFPYAGDHTVEDRFAQYRLPVTDVPLVHGHTHSTDKVSYALQVPRRTEVQTTLGVESILSEHTIQLHAGVDAWGYRPVASHELGKLLDVVNLTHSK